MSAQPDGRIEVNRKVYNVWEYITIEPEETWVYLKSYHGKYLSAQPNGTLEWNRDWKRIWERFTVHKHGDKLAFKSYHGKWMSAQRDGKMEVNRDKVNAWELFEVHPPHALAQLENIIKGAAGTKSSKGNGPRDL